MLILLLACAEPPRPTPALPDPCEVMRARSPGPHQAEIAAALDEPIEVARLRVEEARLTGDPGFYTLAEQALDCADAAPEAGGAPTVASRRLRAHVVLQFHRFAEAEALARPLYAETKDGQDAMVLGDALMEQGRLQEAGEAYQLAMNARPGLPIYDRAGWLRWLTGDIAGATQLATLAAQAGSPADPEPLAWVLTRLGWLHALSGEPAREVDLALQLLPDYKPARMARARIRLHAGDSAGAAEDLRVVGPTVEAVWALSEIDPAASVEKVGMQDPRGFARWLADRGTPADLARARALVADELRDRQDATTRMVDAWVRYRAGEDAAPLAREALATGIPEPRVLFEGGLVLGDAAVLERALAMGPGLLPSERRRAQEALAGLRAAP